MFSKKKTAGSKDIQRDVRGGKEMVEICAGTYEGAGEGREGDDRCVGRVNGGRIKKRVSVLGGSRIIFVF